MKKSKLAESQVVFALRQAETGTQVSEVYRKLGISEATFYTRRGDQRSNLTLPHNITKRSRNNFKKAINSEENILTKIN